MDGGLLVAVGAVPGAWLRFWLVNQLQPLLPRRHWATLAVNGSACFGLGVVHALLGRGGASHGLELLLAVGFLGSFSTFSTFSAEVLQVWRQRERRQALLLLLGSVAGGLLAVALGQAVARG